MAFLDEITILLVEHGVGVIDTNIFKSSNAVIPPGDGPYMTIKETGGTGSVRTHNDTATERPTASITVRGKGHKLTYGMAQAAYLALGGANGLFNVSLSGVFYLSITARQRPTDLGKEEGTGRFMLVFNIDAEKQPS